MKRKTEWTLVDEVTNDQLWHNGDTVTEPTTLLIALFACFIAVCTAVLMRSSPPELQGELWFKSILATLIRGWVDDAGGAAEVWEQTVHKEILYHPAGRLAAQKVVNGSTFQPPLPLLEGEQALQERFDTLPNSQSRWRWMFWDEELGQSARLRDPQELGEAYLPQRWMGTGFDWDAIADAAVDFRPQRNRLRSEGVRWVIFTDSTLHPVCAQWCLTLKQELGGDALLLDWDPSTVEIKDLLTTINGWIQTPSDRFVCLGLGRGVPLLLQSLAEDPALRDRVYAVISVGGAIQGSGSHKLWGREAVQEWVSNRYDYVSLDTEMARETPYFSLGLWDPEEAAFGFAGLGLDEMVFPELPKERAPVEGVCPISLGCLPVESETRHLAVRALLIFVSCWIRARVIP